MRIYWIWLSQLEDLSLRQKLELLEDFSDAEEIYFATQDRLKDCDLSVQKALANKELLRAEQIWNQCTQRDIQILTICDEAYPARLRNIPDPPLLLYYKGQLPDFAKQPIIAVVGTRKATPYGLTTTRKLARQIACCGGVIVSGVASGIDAAAMHGALDTQNPVIGVLGCGADVVYPRSNRQLYADTQKNGCLISEYPPGSAPERWHFPQRNRIISGMADGVLVTEAPKGSGALITARHALEQGRDVFVVPGNIDVTACAGSNALLQDGGIPVLSGWDIMKEYQPIYPDVVVQRQAAMQSTESPVTVPKVAEPQVPGFLPLDKKVIDNQRNKSYSGKIIPPVELTELEMQVAKALPQDPRPVDEVIAQTGLPAGKVLGVLTKLSIKGIAVTHPGRLVSVGKGIK